MSQTRQDHWKQAAADAAAKIVQPGMVLGLGSGSTAARFLDALAARIAREGLRVAGIPTSEHAAAQARALGIPLVSFADHEAIDLTVDGADEVQPGTLHLIKGHGGAALREKIVASASRRMAVVADETKIVSRIGSLVAVPVEVAQFGWQATARKLHKLEMEPALRRAASGEAFITDGGNYILDCRFAPASDPAEIARRLDQTVGVVEHGLFLGLATEAFIGGPSGVRLLRRESHVALG